MVFRDAGELSARSMPSNPALHRSSKIVGGLVQARTFCLHSQQDDHLGGDSITAQTQTQGMLRGQWL
jgi:hypothetical protein